MTNLPLLEKEILEGLVDKYVNKAGLDYIYDQNLTMNYHTQFRQQIGTSFLNQSMQAAEKPQQQATLNVIDKKNTLKYNLNTYSDLNAACLMPITSEKIAKKTHKTSLSLVAQALADEDVGIICEYLNDHHELTSLNLCSNKISAKGAEALAAIKTLKQLDLSWNLIGDTGAKALAKNNTLTSLELTGTGISDEGAKALAENRKLSLLNLSHNKIKDEGAQALAQNQTLRTLDVRRNEIGTLGSQALRENNTFSVLNIFGNDTPLTGAQIQSCVKKNSLNLSCNNLNDKDIEVICEYLKDHPEITFLDLSTNKISAKGAKTLAANQILKEIDLSWNPIGDVGAEALAKNNNLSSLNLTGTGITDKGAKALAENRKLFLLDLSHNKIKDEGAQALSQNQTLRTLNLRRNEIGTLGSQALRENKTFSVLNIFGNDTSLTGAQIQSCVKKNSLNLSCNNLNDKDIELICEYLNDHPEITILYLSTNKISAKGAKTLAANQTLKEIDLSWNPIGEVGAAALAKNNNLTSLNLSGTGICDESAKALANNSSLTFLDLSFNKIADEGAQALAKNQTLLTLKINHNQINKLGSEALNNRAFSSLDMLANNILISENQINALQGYKTETTQAVQQKNQNPRKKLSEPHQKFNETIRVVEDKMAEFTRRPHFSNNLELLQAYAAAEKLKIALEKEGELYFSNQPTAKGLKQFQSNCRKHIIEAKLTLDEHRGWEKIMLNIFAIIVTAGVGYAIAAGINIAVKGRFTFFSTDSSEKLAEINDYIKNISPKSS